MIKIEIQLRRKLIKVLVLRTKRTHPNTQSSTCSPNAPRIGNSPKELDKTSTLL